MSLALTRKAAQAELSDDLHMVRLLILLGAAAQWKGTKQVRGITKLAKMDFLLRYPNCLKKALNAKGEDLEEFGIRLHQHEKNTIESKMIRFKYGPWDGRYRRWISLLKAKGLVSVYVEGRTVIVEISGQGEKFVKEALASPINQDFVLRSNAIVKVFGRMSATKLMEFVYSTFPELTEMRWGDEIEI